MAMLLITHDLGVIAESADRVAVMYAGKIVESGDVAGIFDDPQHPYTEGLLTSMPRLTERVDRLSVIPGSVPDATRLPPACRFAPRCAKAESVCREAEPPLRDVGGGHEVGCWMARDYPSLSAPALEPA
jgi:oligopeptide/dipeptide ABC transporter ATP-binding protein